MPESPVPLVYSGRRIRSSRARNAALSTKITKLWSYTTFELEQWAEMLARPDHLGLGFDGHLHHEAAALTLHLGATL